MQSKYGRLPALRDNGYITLRVIYKGMKMVKNKNEKSRALKAICILK